MAYAEFAPPGIGTSLPSLRSPTFRKNFPDCLLAFLESALYNVANLDLPALEVFALAASPAV